MTLMTFVSKVISENGLKRPDDRPLYRYKLAPETFAGLEKALQLRVDGGWEVATAAPGFVLWAAEHIRARFPGGVLKWAFVLDGLGLPPDDQDLGRTVVEQCLSWWGRKIRVSDMGVRLFLYSLMA